LIAEFAGLRQRRADRGRRIEGRLAELGVDLDYARVAEIAGDAPVGRPHIAEALVEVGAVTDLSEAFSRYLADGGPAWEPKGAGDPVRLVRLAKSAGAAVVVAHPGGGSAGDPVDAALADELVAAGLDGVEADHPTHDAATAEHWRAYAKANRLEVTGASDFHGDRKDVGLGACRTASEVVGRLAARAGTGYPRSATEG